DVDGERRLLELCHPSMKRSQRALSRVPRREPPERESRHLRLPARPRDDDGLRQSRVDRAADAAAVPRGLHLRSRAAGGVGRADDVPHAIARATHIATLPPKGPVFVSIPMDDWAAAVDEDAAAHQLGRSVSGAAAAPVRELAEALANATNPVMVAGPDVDAGG